jgi:pyruvate formate lyase activating enzyme
MEAMESISTRYWHALDDGRVQCDVCPRGCRMHDGQRGLCFVRGVEAGEVRLYTHGRSSGFCVDPIEKKPLNHFLPVRRCFPSVRPDATWLAAFARTGT